jgi:DNA-directed RNA polymerase specialized sigma24 family protein
MHLGGISRMPFTSHDLRHHAEQNYPLLYAYLHRNAQRFLGPLKYDAFEVDTVIGHVVEQLVRLGLLGGEDHTPLTALDNLSDAQFYAFLNRSVRNKAIDRLRKRRLPGSTAAELEALDEGEGESNPLNDAVESLWGVVPFATPEDITLHLVSQRELRNILKHCIMVLKVAPNQLQAVLQELQDVGADDLLQSICDELHLSLAGQLNPHISQHKDHAHKKLRTCLQQKSSNLTVMIALRLTLYTQYSTEKDDYSADLLALAQHDLSVADVRKGLHGLVVEGMLDWHDEETVHLTSAQLKRLTRFYKEE